MKSLRLFLLLFIVSTGISSGATLHIAGRILGLEPGVHPDSTLDFYFITVFDSPQIDGTFFPSNPGLDLKIYTPADAFGDLNVVEGIVGVSSKSFTLSPGQYVMALAPQGSDFDGSGGPVAVAGLNSFFNFRDYDVTLSGNLRLDEKWIGQTNGTFLKTVVPEPSVSILIAFIAGASALRRKRALVVVSAAAFLGFIAFPGQSVPRKAKWNGKVFQAWGMVSSAVWICAVRQLGSISHSIRVEWAEL